jgi:DNA-binding transcriptional MerR regulator
MGPKSYSIGDVSRMTGLSVHQIRNYVVRSGTSR